MASLKQTIVPHLWYDKEVNRPGFLGGSRA